MSESLALVSPLGLFFFMLFCFDNFNVMVVALTYYILFCCILLLFIRMLLFSNDRKKEIQTGEKMRRNWED